MARVRWFHRLRLLFVLGVLAFALWTYMRERADVLELAPLHFDAPQPPVLAARRAAQGELALEGRVLDAGGAPLPDASVQILAGERPCWATTDGLGRFRIEHLPSGEFEAHVLALGFAPQSFALALPASAPIDLKLQQPRAPLPGLPEIRRSELAIQVQPGPAASLAGYEVWLEPAPGTNPLAGVFPRRVRLDERGAGSCAALACGEYIARLLPAWAAGGSWPVLAELVWNQPVQGGALNLLNQAGSIAGAVRSPKGEPIEGVMLVLQQAGEPARLWPPVATDARGNYAFADVPAGDYQLELHTGAVDRVHSAQLAAGQALRVDFDAIEPQPAEPAPR